MKIRTLLMVLLAGIIMPFTCMAKEARKMTLTITSPAFTHSTVIPTRYTCDAQGELMGTTGGSDALRLHKEEIMAQREPEKQKLLHSQLIEEKQRLWYDVRVELFETLGEGLHIRKGATLSSAKPTSSKPPRICTKSSPPRYPRPASASPLPRRPAPA